VLSVTLAALSVVLGALGFSQVTAKPTEQITFIVEDGLPHGITQDTVEAAAEGIAMAYEPFTMHVVERELTWQEYSHGEIGGVDVLMSVGSDREDPDLSLHDATRVAYSGEDYTASSTVRETFVNNRTLGHGPNAVVGAALTAADLKFDGGVRTPLLWVPLAALPMFIAVLSMFGWLRRLRAQQATYRAFGEAQLRLARTILELETLQLRVDVASSLLVGQGPESGGKDRRVRERLREDWAGVEKRTWDLARTEQGLVADLDGTISALKARTPEELAADLQQFETDTLDLQHRADVLAQAAEVRSGHAGSRSVLDRIAIPLLQSIDEVLEHHELYPAEARALESHRARLLAIAHESPDRAEAASLADRHRDLLERWNAVERDIRSTAARMSRRVASPKTIPNASNTRSVDEAIDGRSRARVSAATAGATDSFAALRAALGLGHGHDLGPLQATERVLELLQRRQSHDRPAPAPPPEEAAAGIPYGLLAGVLPVLLSLGAGFLFSSQIEDSHIQYGRSLTGDRPLAGLQVYGDPGDLAGPVEPRHNDPQTQAESLDLQLIREQMQRSVSRDSDAALLPADVELTVALLPAGDYIDYAPDPEYDHRITIDYWTLIDAQDQVKRDVGNQFPAVLDSRTGDVALGQAILPVWILDDGSYAFDNFLTGEFSVGVSSRMGAYDFRGTEPTVLGTGDMADVAVGWWVAYELLDLGREMEYNHLTMDNVSPAAVFWAVTVSVWTGLLTLVLLGMAVAEAGRRRLGSTAVRRRLAGLRQDLNGLALGLDLSRLDMVAVLGLDSETGGRAEEAGQRLYETALVTAWREVDALERLPRREQRGEAWASRVRHVQRLVGTLATRRAEVARRADELLRG